MAEFGEYWGIWSRGNWVYWYPTSEYEVMHGYNLLTGMTFRDLPVHDPCQFILGPYFFAGLAGCNAEDEHTAIHVFDLQTTDEIARVEIEREPGEVISLIGFLNFAE